MRLRIYPLVMALVTAFLLTAVLLLASSTRPYSSEATTGDHPDAETPGSSQAVLFGLDLTAADQTLLAFITSKLEDHRFSVTSYTESSATLTNFLKTSGKGVTYISTHATNDDKDRRTPRALMVEWHEAAAARDAALAAYLNPNSTQCLVFGACFNSTQIVPCGAKPISFKGQKRAGICITYAGIQRHWSDNNTIVFVSGCESDGLAGAFNARDFFGYTARVGCPFTTSDGTLLFGRLHGATGNGHHRAASAAYAAGGFSPLLAYHHKSGVALQTVLSPAVRQVSPAKDSTLPANSAGSVTFDTKMDTAIDPASVISMTGCDATIKDAAWSSEYRLDFKIEVNAKADGRLVIDAASATSAGGFKNTLDGNQDPSGSEHTGPNGDNFEWPVKCDPCPPSGGAMLGTLLAVVTPACEVPAAYEGSAIGVTTFSFSGLIVTERATNLRFERATSSSTRYAAYNLTRGTLVMEASGTDSAGCTYHGRVELQGPINVAPRPGDPLFVGVIQLDLQDKTYSLSGYGDSGATGVQDTWDIMRSCPDPVNSGPYRWFHQYYMTTGLPNPPFQNVQNLVAHIQTSQGDESYDYEWNFVAVP